MKSLGAILATWLAVLPVCLSYKLQGGHMLLDTHTTDPYAMRESFLSTIDRFHPDYANIARYWWDYVAIRNYYAHQAVTSDDWNNYVAHNHYTGSEIGSAGWHHEEDDAPQETVEYPSAGEYRATGPWDYGHHPHEGWPYYPTYSSHENPSGASESYRDPYDARSRGSANDEEADRSLWHGSEESTNSREVDQVANSAPSRASISRKGAAKIVTSLFRKFKFG